MAISSLLMWKSWKDVNNWGTLNSSLHQKRYLKHWKTFSILQCTLRTLGQWLPKTSLRYLSPKRRRKSSRRRAHPHHRGTHMHRQRRRHRSQKRRVRRKSEESKEVFNWWLWKSSVSDEDWWWIPDDVQRWWSDGEGHRGACSWHWGIGLQKLPHRIGICSPGSDGNNGE